VHGATVFDPNALREASSPNPSFAIVVSIVVLDVVRRLTACHPRSPRNAVLDRWRRRRSPAAIATNRHPIATAHHSGLLANWTRLRAPRDCVNMHVARDESLGRYWCRSPSSRSRLTHL